MKDKLQSIDWEAATSQMNDKGYSLLRNVLTEAQCDELIGLYPQSELYRKTVVMERHRFGVGEYKYFNYPLPDFLQTIRESVYPQLVPLANRWMKALKMEVEYPSSLAELSSRCQEQNQTKPTVLILKYGKGGHNTLHQDLYGDIYFPFQMVFFLSDHERDFTGGEFVMTEQVPRAQSKPIVLSPAKGDGLLLTTNFRPVRGIKGYYRAHMRHGVSEVHDGSRFTLGMIFHDAKS